MKKKIVGFLLIIGIISILTACGGEKKVEPVAINEETDICAVCNMQVVDNQFATQVILENGKSLVFDDIGCMYSWMKDNSNQKIAAQFIRDYNTQDWVSKDEATYVYNPDVITPMAYNVISFTEKADAEKFAADNEGSTLLTVGELDQHKWDANQNMMDKNGVKDHSHSEDGMTK